MSLCIIKKDMLPEATCYETLTIYVRKNIFSKSLSLNMAVSVVTLAGTYQIYNMKAYNAIVLHEAINDVYFEDTGKKLVRFLLNILQWSIS